MPPKKRAKKTFTFPVVNKHFYRYVGRTIQVADKWWDEKVFSIDDSRTLCIVEEHEPSHQFPHKARCHAFSIRVLDPLNAVERANAEPLEDPDHFKRLYWMDVKAVSKFHNETYPNWNLSTFRDDVTDVTVENSPSQQTVTQANPHVQKKRNKGRQYADPIYQCFPLSHGLDSREQYTVNSLKSSEDTPPKTGLIFVCGVVDDGATEACGHEVKIIEGISMNDVNAS